MAIVEVLKYNGAPDVLAWKYPSEELGTWTQLIVNEAQEAVLYKSGIALDVFGSGRHTLETANIPLLNHIVNLPFGGRSPFAAEVWFINKSYVLDVKWGTATPVQLQDAKYGIIVPVRSYGQFGIRISESKKFLVKLVGTLPVLDKNTLLNHFRGLYLTRVKDAISSYLIFKKISILEISAYLDELSQYMEQKLRPTLDEYGIELVNFFVNDVSVPEDDPAVQTLKQALAKRAEMNIIGYDYQQERTFDTMETAAGNPGSDSAGIMGAGLGLGLGIPLGGAMAREMGGMAGLMNGGMPGASDGGRGQASAPAPVAASAIQKKQCQNCRSMIDITYRYCPVCGGDAGASGEAGETRCDGCGAKLSGSPKFCPECGKALMRSCPGCGAKLTGEPKFCPECGQALSNGKGGEQNG